MEENFNINNLQDLYQIVDVMTKWNNNQKEMGNTSQKNCLQRPKKEA